MVWLLFSVRKKYFLLLHGSTKDVYLLSYLLGCLLNRLQAFLFISTSIRYLIVLDVVLLTPPPPPCPFRVQSSVGIQRTKRENDAVPQVTS